MLADDELKDLAADITERGLLMPIVLDSEGRILDGRNRYAACGIAGVEPQFTTYTGGDPDGYALAVNIARRHLTAGGRALITEQGRRLTGMSKFAQSQKADIERMRLVEAGLVLDWCDQATVNSVIAGHTPMYKAVELARELKQTDKDEKTKRARLSKGAPDLLNLVVEESLPLDEAISLLEQREAKAAQEADERAAQRREKEQADRENRIQANSALALCGTLAA